MPQVTIGIPVYNRGASLPDLLRNIRQRTSISTSHEIVVVDDSGKDYHQKVVREACSRYDAKLIIHQKNRGVAAGWNSISKASSSEYVVILNDDVFVADDWLSYMAYALRENPRVGSFGMNCRFISKTDAPEILKSADAKVIPLNVHWRNGNLIRDERYKSMPEEEDGPPGRVMCPTGCFFGFRREVYDLVGGFDERYFAFYEETDFGVACAWKGYPSFVLGVPDHNYHMWSASFASAPEISAGTVMNRSRDSFVQKWSKLLGVKFSDAPELHRLLMDKIEPMPVKWLGKGKVERVELL